MRIDAIAAIKQDIEYKKSRVIFLQEELISRYNSEDSKYITRKDLEHAILDLENAINEINGFYVELRDEFDQNNSNPAFRILG